MKEEDIDKRIERVIESVGSKKAAMRQWESEYEAGERMHKVAAKRWRVYGISVAVSIALICGIGISLYLDRPGEMERGETTTAPVFRGGAADITEIQAMMDSAKYETALQTIEATIADTLIDPSFTPERQEYLRSLNASRIYELQWLKINALVKSGKKTEAIILLKEYVKIDGNHRQEAQTLLNNLKR